jgi:hypothetical protein
MTAVQRYIAASVCIALTSGENKLTICVVTPAMPLDPCPLLCAALATVMMLLHAHSAARKKVTRMHHSCAECCTAANNTLLRDLLRHTEDWCRYALTTANSCQTCSSVPNTALHTTASSCKARTTQRAKKSNSKFKLRFHDRVYLKNETLYFKKL